MAKLGFLAHTVKKQVEESLNRHTSYDDHQGREFSRGHLRPLKWVYPLS